MNEKIENRNRLLEEVCLTINNGFNGARLAEKFDVTPSYISQLKTKVLQLRNPPKIIEGSLVCFNCELSKKQFVFHHNHRTGEQIAIVCNSCNQIVGSEEDIEDKDTKDKGRTESFFIKPKYIEQYNKLLKQYDGSKSELIRERLFKDPIKTEVINTELREVNEKMMKYRDLYNILIQWIEDGKLGFTDLMVPSELEKLEGMTKW